MWALLLGGVGAHKFYLGKSGQGFLYLLFCWTFIPVFVSVFELIQLTFMSEDEFNIKYNGYGRNTQRDTSEELMRLHTMMKEGVITEEEFERRKVKLL